MIFIGLYSVLMTVLGIFLFIALLVILAVPMALFQILPVFVSFTILLFLLWSFGFMKKRYKIVDSSAFVDGRIIDLVQRGFLEGPFLIPKFIIRELHRLSDSSNHQRRAKGRRALDNVTKLQNMKGVVVKVDKADYRIRDVDTKLVKLSKKRKAILVTTDFNLSKVAEIESIRVINLNTLSNTFKKIILPNEELEIELLKKGDKEDQAVGYLDDGTMVVVFNAASKIGEKVKIITTITYPTQAGRIVFGKLK